MQGFMFALLVCSAAMSVVAVLYMAFMPKRYSKKWRYYIWLIIVLGFIVPFRPNTTNSVVSFEVPTLTFTVDTIFLAESGYEPVLAGESLSQTSLAGLDISWWHVAFFVWLGGASGFLLYHIIRHSRFIKAVWRWSEAVTDQQTLAQLEEIKTHLGITRQISLYACPFGGPMAIGIFKPKIFLPEIDMGQNELRLILLHELIHLKRHDLLYKYLVMAMNALHWFNPVAHLSARAIDVLCEASCDAQVLESAGEDARGAYSEALLEIVRHQSKLKTAFSTNFNRGKKGMKSRIYAINDTGKKRAGVMLASGVALLTVGTSFVFTATPAAAMLPEEQTDMQLFIYQTGYVALGGFGRVHRADHSLLWGTPRDAREIVLRASQPLHNVSLVHFAHVHDHIANEDLFVINASLMVTENLALGDAILIYNFASPDFVPWSIISFYSSLGVRHFFTIGYNALDITSQVRFE
ncbi:MAG: M56 family metallopeptidase [Defluviitaleaceae bacterium]|nr:M56 family metallopeptidase [Defluviitaleaceae bacterium]